MKIKKYLKSLMYLLGIQYLFLRLKEIYMKIFFIHDRYKEKYIQKKFKKILGYDVEFTKKLVTFNQKIQFRKRYDNNWKKEGKKYESFIYFRY